MSTIHGIQLVCDACGHTIFLAKVPMSDAYEQPPEHWTKLERIGDLCPCCSLSYSNFLRQLIPHDKIPEEWRDIR